MNRLNGNRVTSHLKDLNGGVLLPQAIDMNGVARAILAYGVQTANIAVNGWPVEIGEVLDHVTSHADDPPTPYQQASLNMLAALTECQRACRAALAAHHEAQRATPATEGETDDE